MIITVYSDAILFSEGRVLALSELWIKQLSIFQMLQCHWAGEAEFLFLTEIKAVISNKFQIILAGYILHTSALHCSHRFACAAS